MFLLKFSLRAAIYNILVLSKLEKKSESVTIVFFRHCGFGSPIYREAGACGKVLITFDLAAILPVALSSIVHSSTPNSIYYIITTMPRVYYDRSV